MAFLRRRLQNGTTYYSLVENQRRDGEKAPTQVQLEWLGTYDEAIANIEQSTKIPDVAKTRYLLRLAELEGVKLRGKLAVPERQKLYQCVVVTPNWGELEPEEELEYCLNLPVDRLSDRKGCVLWLWFKNEYFREANQCVQAWGFEPRTILTWLKVNNEGIVQAKKGAWLNETTEQCILATKGEVNSFSYLKTLTDESTVLLAKPRQGNRKPDEFFQMVDRLQPDANKVLMLGAKKYEGWDNWDS